MGRGLERRLPKGQADSFADANLIDRVRSNGGHFVALGDVERLEGHRKGGNLLATHLEETVHGHPSAGGGVLNPQILRIELDPDVNVGRGQRRECEIEETDKR
jgi:hypothetical protein